MLASSRILLVDDTPENLDVLSAILEDLGCKLIVATNGERAIELAHKQHPDLILLDVMMPGMNGFEVCNLLKADAGTADIPIIFVTARTDDISVGFSVGGSDYISKPINADEVRARVRHQLERKALLNELQILNKELEQKVRERTSELTIANRQLREEINERRYMQDRLNYLATHDFVTRLHNRSALEAHVCSLLSHLQTGDNKASFLLIDIDRFRVINESCGCIAGDELLRQFSDSITGLLSREDFFARIGSDKFAIATQSTDVDKSEHLAALILQHIKNFTFIWQEREFKLIASIALVPLNRDIVSFDQVMLMADEVLFLAKREGRGLIRSYNEATKRSSDDKENINWAQRLVDANHNKLFRAYFQLIQDFFPDTTQPRKIRIETLIRMLDPTHNRLIPPAEFIGPAERLHLIPELDKWMIEEVLTLLSQHKDLLAGIKTVSMNLSALSLREPHFADHIIELINKHNVPASMINFEITETEAITNLDVANEFMSRLHELGCFFSLDDFGSGFASYAYLHTLAFDTLKIDGIFVRDMDREPHHYAMVKAIVEMAQSLNKEVVAEFVETPEVTEKLKALNVRWGQGFLFHKPEELSYQSLLNHLPS
ncbi:putative bifunctional diguanylate cyclase/phosphodiesterase [Cellvibrio sp.]|uniref:putative bifunctional diguanylate cyclase/phosphodiesterase n=1 Tax=Cellvibrio sp. TaxID=1965322 RepID=UPI0039648466